MKLNVSLLLSILVLGGLLWSEVTGAARVLVLAGQNTVPYQEVVEGFARRLKGQTSIEMEVHQVAHEAKNVAVLLSQKPAPDLIFSVGASPTDAALNATSEIPVVATMVLEPELPRGAPNATGVVLEFPFRERLLWLKKLLPGKTRVAVLYDPKSNGERFDRASRVATEMGLTLQGEAVRNPRDLPAALDAVLRQSDVLWGVADETVLSEQTAKYVLLFSFRNRLPFVGPSAAWVRAGALYGLDRDYLDLGAQSADLAMRILRGESPASIVPQSPRKVVYDINLKTVRHLNLKIPEFLLQEARNVIE